MRPSAPRNTSPPTPLPRISAERPPLDLVECTMDETTRKNAAQALQRALDRRDNGGDVGGDRR
ncbi:hypothetical protein [Streptodolium elevatio]